MAISYEIYRIDVLTQSINIKYTHSDENLPDWYTRTSMPANATEAQIHTICEEIAEDAALFWQSYRNVDPFELEENSKTIKNIQIEDVPEFDSLYERIEPVYTEDEDTKFKSWQKVPFTADERAANIRHRREQQLQMTDMEAVSDRTPSQEMLDYRQALRDITNQETFPNSVIWPIKPIG